MKARGLEVPMVDPVLLVTYALINTWINTWIFPSQQHNFFLTLHILFSITLELNVIDMELYT